MNNKYRITKEKINYRGKILKRIVALKSFGNVKKGERGGWIQGEWNLSQGGDCWVGGEAKVYENANVLENAVVTDNAILSGRARILGNARIGGEAHIWDDARIFDNAELFGSCLVFDNASVAGNARISGLAKIYRDAYIDGNIEITDSAEIFGTKELVLDNSKNKKLFRIGSIAKLSDIEGEMEIYDWHSQFPLIITKNPKTLYHCGKFSGTKEEFLQFIRSKNLTII